MASCVKCGARLERPAVGRPPTYCSVPCRRAAEDELRRLQRAITTTEATIRHYEEQVATGSWGGSPQRVEGLLAFYRERLADQEERLRALLSDPDIKGEPRS